eukprot:scaffold7730_cov110-Isochrysis_galbana.AAC.11
MAPRQLRLEPIEVDMGADKGLKRVRVESTEENSTQVQLSARATAWGTAWPCPAPCAMLAWPDHCPELRLPAREVSAAKDPFGSRSTPLYYHSFG